MKIFLVGFMGCGKTTVGKRLANRLGLQFLDLDHYLENKFGQPVSLQFEEWGEEVFRQHEQQALHEVVEKFDNVLVSTGGGAPCFFDNMEFMKASGVTIYLKMTPAALASRLKGARKTRPLLKDKTPEELLQYVEQTLQKRDVFYESARIVVSALSIDVDGLVERVYRMVK